MRVVFRHAWMQKHPTPSNRGGDFHWHPSGAIPPAIRSTLGELTTRERGQKASLWIIDPSYVAWARTFAAVSPGDQRRYTGLAATIAQPAGDRAMSGSTWSRSLPGVFAALPLVPAVPLDGSNDRIVGRPAAPLGDGYALHCTLEGPADAAEKSGPQAVEPDLLRRLFDDGERRLAGALYRGGPATSRDAHSEHLPGTVGKLLSWFPPNERIRPRTGVFTARSVGVEKLGQSDGVANFFHYLTRAWFCPAAISRRRPGYALDCWQLVLDLSARALPELFADLTRMATAWDTAENLYRYLVDCGALSPDELAACEARAPRPLYNDAVSDAGWLWNRLLHYWGRGFLPERLLPQLADLLARRIAIDHLFHLDAPDDDSLPGRYLRRLRYEALLPQERVAAMMGAVSQTLPSLSPHSEVYLG
ncbi:MAG: hypothetical protein MJE77_44470 [Proteobacteria bacterium]|nr:hypothetical protein [Pseudomonadota bacterium]